MSQVVDTKVVEMQFDNSKFEKNIEVSLNSLKNLNKSIDDAGKNRNSLDSLAKASDQVGISFDNMNMKSRISLNLFDMLAGVGTKAFNRISDAVAGFALNMANSLSGMQAMRDGFNEYELKMGSVQTMLVGAKIIDPNTLKATKDEARRLEIINDELAKLNEYSDKTIYSFKDMTSNIGKFTNNGVELHDAVDAIQGVANVAAAAGANSSEASRAMYNFSQALSSGAVKLIDWKSIENANMATQDFKQQLLDTAQVLGTVVKNGKEYTSTTTDLQGKVSDAFTKTKGFNDSLSHQWMTTEVLTQTLKNYSTDVRDMSDNALEKYRNKLMEIGYTSKQVDRIIETSRKAFEAATEVKTFSQMIDTLKESLGSGWAQTFEIVIGDFREAKKLFTDLNNTIDNLLSPIGKARNAILQMWKDDGGRQALINSFANIYHAIQNLFDPLKELWRAFTPTTSNTGKGLATITKWIEKLTAAVRTGSVKVSQILSKILKPVVTFGRYINNGLLKLFGNIRSGWSKISGVLSTAGKGIKTFGGIVSKAFAKHIVSRIDAFKTTLANTFGELKKRVKESSAIQGLVKAFNDLKLVVHDLFERVVSNATGYAHRFSIYLGKIWKAVAPLVSSAFTSVIKSLSNIILPRLRKAIEWVSNKLKDLGDLINKIDIKNSKLYQGLAKLPDQIKALGDNKTFKTVFNGIKSFGSEAFTFLSDKFASFKTTLESIKMPNGLRDLFENIKNFIKSIFGKDSVKDDLSSTLEETVDVTDKVTGEQSGEKLTLFQRFLEGVSTAFEWVKTAAGTARDAIADFVNFVRTNTPKALKSFHDFLAGEDGILTMSDIVDAVYLISDAFSMLLTSLGFAKIGKAADNITDALSNLADATVNFAKRLGNKFNMEAMRDFSIGVGILVASMWVLSKIPTDKLAIVSGVVIGLGYALTKFFSIISNGKANLAETAGFIPIAILLIAIAGGMIAVAASIGILVGVLAVFPKVIKQYNNLGDKFREGMNRVKEVLEQIFEYLDHAAGSKYSFRSAMALLGLVIALSRLQKVILKFASKKMADSMADGLQRISQVLGILGSFLSGIQLGSFSFINIGIDFDTVGMAAMILALGFMIDKITPAIEKLSQLTPSQFETAFDGLKKILTYFGLFLASTATISYFNEMGLGKWLGVAVTVGLIALAVSSCVDSVDRLAKLANENPDGMKAAMTALSEIFLALGGVLTIIGMVQPKGGLLNIFGLSLAIGVLTICVTMLYPLAQAHPEALQSAVLSIGGLMIALGGALFLAGKAGDKTGLGDILKVIAMTLAMVVLTQAIRRLSKSGGDADSITAAGTAIGVAAMAMAGAVKIMNGAIINPTVLIALGLLTAAIWGIAAAVAAFKGTAVTMADTSQQVSDSMQETGDVMGVETEKLAAYAGEAFPNIFENLGPIIREALGGIFEDFDLGSSIRNMITTVKEDAKNWAQDFIDIGTNLVDGISTAITNPSNVAKVKESILALGEALLESFKLFFGIHSPSTVMAEQGGFILDGLVQGLMEFPSKLAGWVSSIGDFILNSGIGQFFTGAVEKGKELISNIGAGIQNGKSLVTKKASEIGQAALKNVGKAKEWAASALKSANSFGSKLSASRNPIKKAAGTMIVGATNSVAGMAKIFGKSSAAAAAKFSAQLNAGKGPAKAAGSAIVAGAKSAFSNITASFREYGRNAAEGFRNGINSLIAAVAAKAKEMVRRAKESAKSEQNSNSPSKDFMEYGGWAAQGYALGMINRKNTRMIEANARSMVNHAKTAALAAPFGSASFGLDSNPAMSSLAYAMSQISDTLDENMNTSPTIRPVIDMSNVNHGASAIAALFGDKSIGTSVDVIGNAQGDFNQTMTNRANAYSLKSIDKLASRINSMTDAMNSRSMNNYITVDGATDPSAFADELIRGFRLNARTV